MEKLLQNFKTRIEKEHNLVEALCLSNKDGLIWQEQYIPRNYRNIYSHSKSFTSLMAGIAIDEGMLDFDMRLVDVFKDEIDLDTYHRLYLITVRDLLNMSSGFGEAYLMENERREGIGYPDYLEFMLSRELKYKPGTKFHYSNGDTYLVSRIISKLYNRNFTQLCYEKIFKPLDIKLPAWGVDPMGYCLAATQLNLNVVDMNKLGILYLNNGVYKGKRVVSEEYVKLCSTAKIKTDAWGDYSLQFWMTPEGDGYRADGAYGQITFIWPKYGLAFSMQRPEDNNLEKVLAILREEVLSKI